MNTTPAHRTALVNVLLGLVAFGAGAAAIVVVALLAVDTLG
jgi:hypothetical protein